jgi:dUTP pyrophosphatase
VRARFVPVDELPDTERGTGGHGSTGGHGATATAAGDGAAATREGQA